MIPYNKRQVEKTLVPGGRANLGEMLDHEVDGTRLLDLYFSSGLTPDGFRRRLDLGSSDGYAKIPALKELVYRIGERLQSYEDFKDRQDRKIENGYMSKINRAVRDLFGTPRRMLNTGGIALGGSAILGAANGVLGHQYSTAVHIEPNTIKIPFGPDIVVVSKDFAQGMNDMQNAIGTVVDAIQGAAQGILFLKDVAPEIALGVAGAYAISAIANGIARSNGHNEIELATVEELSEDIENYRGTTSL